jgi:hypothetical protein
MAVEVRTAVVADLAAAVVDFMAEAEGPTRAGRFMAAVRTEAEAWAAGGPSADPRTAARHLAAVVASGRAVRDRAPWAARTRVLVQV